MVRPIEILLALGFTFSVLLALFVGTKRIIKTMRVVRATKADSLHDAYLQDGRVQLSGTARKHGGTTVKNPEGEDRIAYEYTLKEGRSGRQKEASLHEKDKVESFIFDDGSETCLVETAQTRTLFSEEKASVNPDEIDRPENSFAKKIEGLKELTQNTHTEAMAHKKYISPDDDATLVANITKSSIKYKS